MELHCTILATLEAVSWFTQDLEIRFAYLSIETRTTVVLALHELLVNIIRHAYAGTAGEIDICILHTDAALTITVTDSAAHTFEQPALISAPDPHDLPEHGMGLFIIHQAFDEITYKRLAHGNQWHLTAVLGG